MTSSVRTTAFFLGVLLAAGCGGGTSYVPTSSDAGLAPESTRTTSLSKCTTVTKSGTYNVTANLTGDLQPAGPACILVQNTSNVTLNCQKHTLTASSPAIEFNNVSGFTIENCNLISDNVSGNSGQPSILLVQGSSNGAVTNNTAAPSTKAPSPVWATVDIVHSSKVTVTANTFLVTTNATYSSGTVFSKNTITCSLLLGDCPSVMTLSFGTSDQVIGSTLDGMSATDGQEFSPGSDDGVLLYGETSPLVENNIIKNVWDCGLETFGPVSGATVSNNAFSNTTNCGMGGWYYLHLSNSTFSGNTVSGSNALFVFERDYGLGAAGYLYPGSPAETGVYFTGNTFTNNSFTNPFNPGLSSWIPIDAGGALMGYNQDGRPPDPTASQFHLANNAFGGNNFGKGGALYLGDTVIPGAVIDKGGNRCITFQGVPNYPIACSPP
jgi:parallel beta-helix repeat protein